MGIFSYIEAAFIAFLANLIPIFAPPTWIMLSLCKVNHPELNSIALAFFGVIGSVAGRSVMYLYSKMAGEYIPRKYMGNVDYLKRFVERKRWGLFFGSFIYSLSPFPSNLLFIGSGITGIEAVPVLAGFALGRLISYASLVYVFYRTFGLFSIVGIEHIRLLADLFGILAAVSIIFIDWKKVLK